MSRVRFMRKAMLVLVFCCGLLPSNGQSVIALWNFNTPLPPDNNLNTGSTVASMGIGDVRLIGGTLPSGTNPFNGGSDNDPFTSGTDNTAWNIRNYPAQGTFNKTAGIQFSCSSVGYQNIIFRFDEKHSASAPNTTVVQYNPDTTNAAGWVDIQVNKLADTTYSETYLTHIVDLSSISAVNNRPRLGIRIVAAFDPDSASKYIASYYKTAAGYSPGGGTIRFDMASFTGLPQGGCSVPSVQAGGVDLISTTASSISFSYHRGSGDSVLIVCRSGYAVNSYPLAGFRYNASSNYGSGSQVGSGNYAVWKTARPGKDTVTVTGLQANQSYHFSVFEFSAGLCYKIKPLYFYFTTGGTVFNPGELQLIGFDSRLAGNGIIGSGNDVYFITNLVEIKPGTQFSLASSRYEAGAAPNIRTGRWYNSGDYIYRDLDVQEFTWTGSSNIAAGSVIGLQDKRNSSGLYDSVTINGVYAPQFISDSKKGELNTAAYNGKGEQLFITQGPFYPVGEYYADRYNLLFGRVLFGISFFTDWVPVSATPGVASSGTGFRQSRIPPDIECLKLANLSDTAGAGYYFGTHTGTRKVLKLSIDNGGSWKWIKGDTLMNLGLDFISPYTAPIGEPFIVSRTAITITDATWSGSKDTEWFDCQNWEGLFVPDYRSDVILNTGAPHYPVIHSGASCKSLTTNGSSTIEVSSDGKVDIGVDP